MEEKEFVKKLMDLGLDNGFQVYWTLDEEENVVVDYDSMREEFEQGIKDIEEILKDV